MFEFMVCVFKVYMVELLECWYICYFVGGYFKSLCRENGILNISKLLNCVLYGYCLLYIVVYVCRFSI